MSTYNEYIFIKIWNDGDILNNELEMVIVQIITVLTYNHKFLSFSVFHINFRAEQIKDTYLRLNFNTCAVAVIPFHANAAEAIVKNVTF